MNDSLKKAVKSTEVLLTKHSPEILTGLGIVGMFSMTVTAVRATPKALILIQNEKEMQDTDKLSWQKKVKASYKCYLPSVAIAKPVFRRLTAITAMAILNASKRLATFSTMAYACAKKSASTTTAPMLIEATYQRR